MKKSEWAAVAAVLAIGVVAQVVGHNHTDMANHVHDSEPVAHPPDLGLSRVTLAVSGMT